LGRRYISYSFLSKWFLVSVPAATAAGSYISTDFECVLRCQYPVLSDSGGTWDKTVSNKVDVRVKWSVASASNAISPYYVPLRHIIKHNFHSTLYK